MAKFYFNKDADLKYLKNRKIAVIGYGSQGHAQSQNLKDSGMNVVVADVPNSDNWKKALKAKMKIMRTSEASMWADVIMLVVPDTIQSIVYENEIKRYICPEKVLMFSHGFNIRYGLIRPPEYIDVILVAPKGPGHLLRSEYQQGRGVPNLIAVHQDFSGNAKNIALAYSKAIGGTRAVVIETTFEEETETDLFGEQNVLCGGISQLIISGFETLVKAGYQPEVAYFECLHEMKLITDMIYEGGLSWMRYSVSDTAEWGDYYQGKNVIGKEARKAMRESLKRIQNGSFAKEWVSEYRSGGKRFYKYRKQAQNHLIERIGKRLRNYMTWIKKRQTETGGR
ncbi:MAG: ketol-acid reductoisomerase [Candidatus Hydrogenedentota bacterium]